MFLFSMIFETVPWRWIKVKTSASGKRRPWSFGGALDSAFDQIRQYGRGAPAVMIRLADALTLIAAHLRRDEDVAAVRRQVEMLGRGAETFDEELDRRALRQRLDRARDALARCDAGAGRAAA